jgi:hypothetical protein
MGGTNQSERYEIALEKELPNSMLLHIAPLTFEVMGSMVCKWTRESSRIGDLKRLLATRSPGHATSELLMQQNLLFSKVWAGHRLTGTRMAAFVIGLLWGPDAGCH